MFPPCRCAASPLRGERTANGFFPVRRPDLPGSPRQGGPPLALSQYLRRDECPCKYWSAAPTMPTGLPFSKFSARAETPLENLDGGPCSASAVSAAGSASAAQHFIRRRRRFGGVATRSAVAEPAVQTVRLPFCGSRGSASVLQGRQSRRTRQKLPPFRSRNYELFAG